jgi:hypothetical protein
MSVGIDLFPYGLAFSVTDSESNYSTVKQGIIGIPPRINESTIWNESNALRDSRQGKYISLTNAWSEFMGKNEADKNKDDGSNKIKYLNYDGNSESKPSADLIADALKGNIPASYERVVYTIDNNLNEFKQDTLLKSLRNQILNIELLWRPVAIALDFLNTKGRGNLDDQVQLLIVDTDSYTPELTVFNLEVFKGCLVPVRTLPEPNQNLFEDYSSFELKRTFIEKISANDDEAEQLANGPFTADIFNFLEGNKKSDIFLRSGLSHYKFNLKDEWIEEIKDHSVNDFNFQKVREIVHEKSEFKDSNYVLWNGFSSRIQERNNFSDKEVQLDNLALARGASNYASRLKDKLPTYLDTLPGLEILSTVEGQGNEFFPIIKPGKVEGGQTQYIPEPITNFKIEKGVKNFTSVLRNITDRSLKKIETLIPDHDYDDAVPVVIKGQMKPANGNALITIEGDSQHQNIFGERSYLEMDWKLMEPFEFTQYSGPIFYPVKGRIKDNPKNFDIIQGYIDRGFLDKGYIDIHKPQGEPTRPLFGAEDENDPKIDNLAKEISSLLYQDYGDRDRHKYLNYMFRYAPESFIQELRDLYSKTNPTITNWNTVYAVGRTFYRPEDFELFVDFFLEKSEQLGYPAYIDTSYTKCYYWSFFRALCYYEHTVNIPVKKAEKVLLTLCKVVEDRRSDNWQPRPSWAEKNRWARNAVMNLRKFLLSCILFSLRFRKIDPNFLDLDSELYKKMEDLVNHKIPKTPYPRAMFSAVQKDSLNDYVYRFLSKEQTDSDLEAIKGLITSI